MSAVVQQRCHFHFAREAVARCPECRQFYCRECVTEHDDRLICATCLKKAGLPANRHRHPGLRWSALAPAAGFLLAWLCFFLIGRLLASLPSDLWGAS